MHVDGCISESVDLPSATCTGAAVLLLGHGGGGGDTAGYELSSVLVFSEPVLDLEQAFILRLLGPDCTDLTACASVHTGHATLARRRISTQYTQATRHSPAAANPPHSVQLCVPARCGPSEVQMMR